VASAIAIVAKVAAARADARGSSLPDAIRSLSTPAALRTIGKAARQGDPLARHVLQGAARYLGIAAAGCINLLDPELLILTGMVTYESGDLLLDFVRQAVGEHVLQDGGRAVRIERGTLGNNAAMIGAAAAVCERAFRVPVEAEN
jgi:predicted NBD/HSP70 family sugar kinase